MRFQFIHAADLHIDSPLAALGAKDPAIAATFAAASRKAVERLIAETIQSNAKFLVIAGDVFDGDWRDVATGLFFVRELGKLDRAGVPTFIVKGNHDAESVISRSLPYPASVHVFEARKNQTQTLEDLRIAVHGRSFSERTAPDDFLAGYAPRREGWLNIGVLHTSLEGGRGQHKSYAPCAAADLVRFGYDYWALGHIHAAEVVARDPWIVYPGNVQGRNPRETGPKGAMRVTVEDGRIVAVEPFALDAARWAHLRVDVTGDDEDAVRAKIADALRTAHGQGDALPLAIRLTLAGETSAHAALVARSAEWLDDARSQGLALAAECWVEKLRLETFALAAATPADPDALDLDGLLAATASDPEFADFVRGLAASAAEKLPRDLRDEFLAGDPVGRIALARDLLLGVPG